MTLTTVNPALLDTQAQYTGFKNRIINGAMVIDQRNAGAATANTINGYVVDRWQVNQSVTGKVIAQQNAGAVTPPAGYVNYLGVTSQSAYSIGSSDYYAIQQGIEGFNTADLGWGTASAQPVTLSMLVRSSLTGIFGGSVRNSAANRSYAFSYSISVANTWTAVSVTIPGDTTGIWLTNNGAGLYLSVGLGVGATYSGTAGAWAGAFYFSATGATSVVGTSGATFYITGVQLEKGSTATSFDYRPYGTELGLCQRYYVGVYPYYFTIGYDPNYSVNRGGIAWSYQMRATPSIIIASGGMVAHHTTPPAAAGILRNGAFLEFSGAAVRTDVSTAAEVSFTLSAEL